MLGIIGNAVTSVWNQSPNVAPFMRTREDGLFEFGLTTDKPAIITRVSFMLRERNSRNELRVMSLSPLRFFLEKEKHVAEYRPLIVGSHINEKTMIFACDNLDIMSCLDVEVGYCTPVVWTSFPAFLKWFEKSLKMEAFFMENSRSALLKRDHDFDVTEKFMLSRKK